MSVEAEIGAVDDMSLETVIRTRKSDQYRIGSFNGSHTTYVSIVNSLSDEMERETDEHDPRLAPPDQLFGSWLTVRKKYMNDGQPKPVAHNNAFDDVGYERRFRGYLDRNGKAQRAINEYVDRVRNGENIVFVCYCNGDAKCHRTIVRDVVERNL